MTIYQVLYWRDIPAQIKVYAGRRPLSGQMPDWFQQEIDRTAMRDGLIGTDAYLDEWHWSEKREWVGKNQAPEDIIVAVLKKLETEYDRNVQGSLNGTNSKHR